MSSAVALARHVLDHGLHKKCHTCKKEGNLKMCSSCKCASYCSRECQVTQYAQHRVACELIGMKRRDSGGEESDQDKKKSRTVIEEDDGPPTNPADYAIYILRDNREWLRELAESDMSNIASWARVSRTFRRYLANNNLFWYFVLKHHFPEVLGSADYNPYIPYRNVTERHHGGLQMRFMAHSYIDYDEAAKFQVLSAISTNEPALRHYITLSPLVSILNSISVSKAFRRYFHQNPLFWYLIGRIKMNLFADAEFNPNADYHTDVLFRANREPVIVTFTGVYQGDKFNGFYPMSPIDDIDIQVEDRQTFIVPYFVFLRDGVPGVMNLLYPDNDFSTYGFGSFDGHEVEITYDEDDIDVWPIYTSLAKDDFTLSDWDEAPWIDLQEIEPGEIYEVELRCNMDFEDGEIELRWESSEITPHGANWENTGLRQIQFDMHDCYGTFEIESYLPTRWVATATGDLIDYSEFELLFAGEVVAKFSLSALESAIRGIIRGLDHNEPILIRRRRVTPI